MSNKKQIAFRFKQSLIDHIDSAVLHTHFQTRTQLIETACAAYIAYLKHKLEIDFLEEHYTF